MRIYLKDNKNERVLNQLKISVFRKDYLKLNFTFSVQSRIKASIVTEDLAHVFLKIVTYHSLCYHFLIFV